MKSLKAAKAGESGQQGAWVTHLHEELGGVAHVHAALAVLVDLQIVIAICALSRESRGRTDKRCIHERERERERKREKE